MTVRPPVVQQAVVLLHFDARFAASLVRGDRPAWLTEDELALLRRTDPRAFRTDPERPIRLVAALLEEFPVSCAIVGRDLLHEFVSSTLFHGAVRKGRLVVDAFGDWLFPRAGGLAQLELAIALARRHRRRRGLGLARAPGVELARVPAGTLAFYAEARHALGDAPREAVAQGRKLTAPVEPAELESLLIEMPRFGGLSDGLSDGLSGASNHNGPSVSACADELLALLAFAREGRTRPELLDEAQHLGAGDDAAELLADLLRDGLLAAIEDARPPHP